MRWDKIRYRSFQKAPEILQKSLQTSPSGPVLLLRWTVIGPMSGQPEAKTTCNKTCNRQQRKQIMTRQTSDPQLAHKEKSRDQFREEWWDPHVARECSPDSRPCWRADFSKGSYYRTKAPEATGACKPRIYPFPLIKEDTVVMIILITIVSVIVVIY